MYRYIYMYICVYYVYTNVYDSSNNGISSNDTYYSYKVSTISNINNTRLN